MVPFSFSRAWRRLHELPLPLPDQPPSPVVIGEHNYFGFDVYWPIKQHFSLSEDFHSKTRDAIEWGPLIYGINGLVYLIWLRTNQMLCAIRYNLIEQYLTGPEF